MSKEQLKIEINHILESGVNDIRLIELYERFDSERTAPLLAALKQIRNKGGRLEVFQIASEAIKKHNEQERKNI